MNQEYKENEWLSIRGEALEYVKNKEEIMLKKWLENIGYKEPIGYYRDTLEKTMKIYATRIGALVGYKGTHVNKLKKMLSEEFYGKWDIEFIDIGGGFVNIDRE